MFYALRIVFIFVFGIAAARKIENNSVGSFVMGTISLILSIWLVLDVLYLFDVIRPTYGSFLWDYYRWCERNGICFVKR
jgi:hypothetical protein